MENLYDVIIIGSGPAGLSAAIYAKRAKLSSLTIEANFASGGQVLNTYEVDNYPGLPGISVPVAMDSKGLPVGLQLVGNCFSEKKLLNAAYGLEKLRGSFPMAFQAKAEKKHGKEGA